MDMSTHHAKADIPVIDFSHWLNSKSKASQLSAAKSLIKAFQTFGFAYITNHNLPPDIINTAFATSKRLFSLDHETKMLAPHPDGPQVHRGYSHPRLEKVSQYAGGVEEVGEKLSATVDCKESYEIGSEENDEQPNVWLPEESLLGFMHFTTRLYWECEKLARAVLQAVAMGIGLEDAGVLTSCHSGLNYQLRLLHYPPIAAGELERGRVARMPAHRDWSSITLLFQDDCGGLEVEDPRDPGRFIPVTPVKNACVVNVGDLLMR